METTERQTLARWVDLLAVAALATVIVELFGSELQRLGNQLAHRVHDWPTGLIATFFLALTVGLAVVLMRLGVLGVNHFSVGRLLKFPPVWCAAVIALIGLCWIDDLSRNRSSGGNWVWINGFEISR